MVHVEQLNVEHILWWSAWSCGNATVRLIKLASAYQQHSNNRSSITYDSNLVFICYIHELRKRSGRTNNSILVLLTRGFTGPKP
jgi:hypothetical protein